uniref:Uncharacterized protein n=1 Tax=Stegastes partitus TaxID=144197 RepID=A0A3B5ABJ3_9TELE
MNWLFPLSKGSGPLPPLNSLQQQRQRQIESLKSKQLLVCLLTLFCPEQSALPTMFPNHFNQEHVDSAHIHSPCLLSTASHLAHSKGRSTVC